MPFNRFERTRRRADGWLSPRQQHGLNLAAGPKILQPAGACWAPTTGDFVKEYRQTFPGTVSSVCKQLTVQTDGKCGQLFGVRNSGYPSSRPATQTNHLRS